MKPAHRSLLHSLLFLGGCILHQSALGWDSVGHRLSALVATQYLSEGTKTELRLLIEQHPRYQQDFLEQMPASIALADEQRQLDWLLGQAAFWPDITRGFPDRERQTYHRANWHYIDGAWLRGSATTQGNTYLGIAPFDDVLGQHASELRDEAAIDNVMLALDYNTALLADSTAPLPRRAVALCWVLHLIGDIHQPLHVGSLFTANRYSNGDRGGNGIETDEGNLHARWDRALRSDGVEASLRAILEQHGLSLERMSEGDDQDWSLWMHESRALLLNSVYTPQMKSSIFASDNSGGALQEFPLNSDYVDAMTYHARLRLALAGRRLALWFQTNLANPL